MSPTLVKQKVQKGWLPAAIATLVLLGACGPADIGADKLKSLESGDSKAEILQVVGMGPLVGTTAADSLRIVSGHRIQKFVTNGQTHEILWYRELPGTVEDLLAKDLVTPVVVVNDTVVGWGWKFFSKYAKTNGLPDPAHDRERLDSISKSQGGNTRTP